MPSPRAILPIGLIVLLSSSASAQSTASAASAFPPDSAVLAILKQRVAEKRSAGIVVGLYMPNGQTRVVAFGDPGPGKPPLDENSVFEIGSISKVFTATLLAELVAEGKVSLDDPVQKFLPSSVHMPSRGGKQITLGNLSEQNSGLPRLPGNLRPKDESNPYADYTVQQMYEFLSGYQLPRDPGASFEYSNLGVGLLGHVLSLRMGKSYEELERERIWNPLGMTHTAIAFTPWMQAHLAPGHDAKGGVAANWDFPTLGGAGAIRSTTGDMLKFVAANLHPERGALEQAMAFAQKPRVPTGVPDWLIGLNWLTLQRPAGDVVWHDGGTGGYGSYVGLVPSRKIGVIVLSNSTGDVADIGRHLLDPELPLAPVLPPPKHRTAIVLPDSVMARYIGVYELTPAFSVTITAGGTALHLQATGQQAFRLWPETETGFFIQEVDAQVTFVRDSLGVVTGLVLHQGGANVPGRKVK